MKIWNKFTGEVIYDSQTAPQMYPHDSGVVRTILLGGGTVNIRTGK